MGKFKDELVLFSNYTQVRLINTDVMFNTTQNLISSIDNAKEKELTKSMKKLIKLFKKVEQFKAIMINLVLSKMFEKIPPPDIDYKLFIEWFTRSIVDTANKNEELKAKGEKIGEDDLTWDVLHKSALPIYKILSLEKNKNLLKSNEHVMKAVNTLAPENFGAKAALEALTDLNNN